MNKPKVFCCYCGAELSPSRIEGRLRDYCRRCRTVFYENPLPVVSCIVVNEDRSVLLIKRKKDPYRRMWCLPIGFAEAGEDMGEAALRELEEEAGIRGDVVRIIDVDTVHNYFYGALAIVTYEVKKTGGTLRPGDDASDAAYFPLSDHPPLAWSSNEKALQIYADLYRDTWAMVDSFRHLFPEMDLRESAVQGAIPQGSLLSDVLIRMIRKDKGEIQARWLGELLAVAPRLAPQKRALTAFNAVLLQSVRAWLKGGSSSVDFRGFIKRGRGLRDRGVTLPDMLTATALSRKSIWMYVVGKKILQSPLEIYTALELNNRIIFLYDKVNYYLTNGWCQ
jgi:ADP-ribose pyrophosphatase YjhB (NUDIX family)